MLTTEQQQIFAEDGYLVEQVLPQMLVKGMRHDLQNYIDREPGNKEVYGDVWYDLPLLQYPNTAEAMHFPALTELLQEFTSPNAQLLDGQLVLIRSSQGSTVWHQDGVPGQITLGIYLHDTSKIPEPLRIAPGSHKWESSPIPANSDQTYPGEVPITMSGGTVLFLHPDLWHTGSFNPSTTDCWLLFIYYGEPEATFGN